MEVSNFLKIKMCVGNGDANSHFKNTVHIYCDSNKTRETCVHIGYFIHSGVFVCFYKNAQPMDILQLSSADYSYLMWFHAFTAPVVQVVLQVAITDAELELLQEWLVLHQVQGVEHIKTILKYKHRYWALEREIRGQFHRAAKQRKLLTRNICLADFLGYQPNLHVKLMYFGW